MGNILTTSNKPIKISGKKNCFLPICAWSGADLGGGVSDALSLRVSAPSPTKGSPFAMLLTSFFGRPTVKILKGSLGANAY